MPHHVSNINKTINLQNNFISYKSLKSYDMPLHDHPAVQILIPLEGSNFQFGWFPETGEKETKTLGTADICVIPPFMKHEVHWVNCANIISFYIVDSYLAAMANKGSEWQASTIEEQIGVNDRFLFQLGHSVRQHILLHQTENHRYFEAVLMVAMQHVLNLYVRHMQKLNLFDDYGPVPCEKIREAILFMSIHLDKHLTVEEIANSVEMSRYHFLRTFKDKVGMTPMKFHMQLRIDKAKTLLKQQSSIIDVAHDLGFSSQSHFTNVFSKMVGMTPNKFLQDYSS
jgi:AraC family transcriptional regulator